MTGQVNSHQAQLFPQSSFDMHLKGLAGAKSVVKENQLHEMS
jgi:hypothetical protein